MNPLALFRALGAYVQFNAAGQEGGYRIWEDQHNEALARAAAADAIARGNQEAGRIRMQGTGLIEKQKVGFAASGVDVGSGTPLEVMAGTRLVSELDARTAENNAAREAWGFRQKALEFQRKRQFDTQRMNNEETGAILTGLGSMLGAGG